MVFLVVGSERIELPVRKRVWFTATFPSIGVNPKMTKATEVSLGGLPLNLI